MNKFLLLFATLMPSLARAAENEPFMYQNGKIYVVVGVLLIIFLGISFFLWRLDKRIGRLEQDEQHQKP
jgi:hypothetical protein